MAVLVTGGAGYIGSHVVWALHDAGEEVYVIDNLSTGFKKYLPRDLQTDDRFFERDYGDKEFVENLVRKAGITDVLHFAGSVVVPESVIDPFKYYANNVAALVYFLEAIRWGGAKRLIFSSTAAVYGTPRKRKKSEYLVTEGADLHPLSPYGSSKLMAERIIQDAAAAYGFNYGILRYFNVAGADPGGRTGQSTKNATHLIKVACEAALGIRRKKITVYGTDYTTKDGTCVRDYIHVTDLASAHIDTLKYLRNGGDNLTANCGYGKGYSVNEVLDTVRRVSRETFAVEYGPRRDGDAEGIIASPQLLKKLTGWRPQRDSLHGIVRSAFDWETKLARERAVQE